MYWEILIAEDLTNLYKEQYMYKICVIDNDLAI